MKNLFPILLLFVTIFMTSCVGKKKFVELASEKEQLQLSFEETKIRLDECLAARENVETQLRTQNSNLDANNRQIGGLESELNLKNREVTQLQDQVEFLKTTNTRLLNQMADLSVVSKTGAESIQKSLESIIKQSEYIKELTGKIQSKDSTNLILVMNLKRSLSDINDEDVQIEVRGGVVYVSISDKLLFKSGSADISSRAETVLAKVAKVINDHSDLDVMVEGHTDNVPIKNACVKDNWDLSVKRATAVIRVLQWRHQVDPQRLTAAGRSQYIPKETNDTSEGKSSNRRTEIVITPKLDQFFKLMEAPEVKN